MTLIRRLDTNLKVYICFALLVALSAALAFWMMEKLAPVTVPAGPAAARLDELAAYTKALVWIGVGVQAALAVLLAFWLKAELARPLHEAAGIARRIAAGNLATRIGAAGPGASGVLLASLQDMNDQLASVTARARNGTDAIAGGAGALACAGKELSARAERHAVAVQQAVQCVGALATGVRGDQGAAIEQLAQAMAALEQSAHENAVLAEHSAEATAFMRDQTGRLSRLMAGFSLGQGHAGGSPRIHLVSINRHPVARPGRERRKQVRIAAVTPAARDSLSSEEINWQTF